MSTHTETRKPDDDRQTGLRPPRWLRLVIPTVLILVWLAVLGAGGSSFGEVNEVSENDQVEHLPASADATKVQELQEEFRNADLVPAVLMFARDGGLESGDEQAVENAVAEVSDLPAVNGEQVSPPITAEDGEAIQVVMPLSSEGEPADTVAEIRDALDGAMPAGLSAAVTGPAGLSADIVDAFSGLDGLLLVVALAAVLVILVIVYRSPLLPFIVLGTSLAALTGAMATVVALARADVLVLSGQTQGILMILVIGAATDYSLLYVARYREALRDHSRRWQATWAALRGSWASIVASGATVIAGLACLLLSELNSNRYMGPVAAVGIVFAQLAAFTLLPSLMAWAGRVAFWPRQPQVGSAHPSVSGTNSRGVWPKVASIVSGRSRTVWVSASMLLVLGAVGLVGLKADGVAQSDFVLGHSEAREGQHQLAEHFPGGSGTPAMILGSADELEEIGEELLDNPGVDSAAVMTTDSPSGTAQLTPEGVAPPPGGDEPVDPTVVDGRVMAQATLTDEPDSQAAEDTIAELRETFAADAATSGVLIGGETAAALDAQQAAIGDRNLVMPLIVVVILLILMVLLRAVVAPLLLLGSVVLSFAAALGVSSLVFNHIFDFPGADPSVPLFGFVFLVALGIDYNIFLMVRVREESQSQGTRAGILQGLVTTGGVITSAGVVLAATFAALGVLPILFLAQISFIVAFGVLVDTILVRSFLVPALSYDIGPRIWWPSRLAKRP